MIKDSIKLTGRLSIKKYDKDGKEIYSKEVPNLVVTSGKEYIAQRLVADPVIEDPSNPGQYISSTGPAKMGFMGVGDDASTSTVALTTLQNELSRVAVTSAEPSGVSATFNATFGPNVATGALAEAGIFNVSGSSVISFDTDTNILDAPTSKFEQLPGHGLQTGDRVTYNDAGNPAVTGLNDGGTYYVIRLSDSEFQLAASESDALAGTFIEITGAAPGAGTTQKITAGTMLCRTTFPVINKSATESVAISWVITVG